MRRLLAGLRLGLSRVPWSLPLALVLIAGGASRALGYPLITITPGDGSYPVGYQVLVRVEFCEPDGYFDASGQVTLNGSVIANGAPGSKEGCADFQAVEVYVTLQSDTSMLVARITSSAGYAEEQRTYTTPPDAPGVGTNPHNGHNWDASLCLHACFNTVVAYSTPAYWSLDVARAVTLIYSSGQLGDRHTIEIDAWNRAAVTPERMSLRLRRSDATFVTFTNGATELFYEGLPGTQRLAAQFQDTTLSTGAYHYTVVVRGYWNGTPQEATAPLRLLVVNERASPYGAGWTVAGVAQILYGPGDSLVVKYGGGTIQYWRRSSCTGSGEYLRCFYAAPAGAFDSLTYAGPPWDLDPGTYRPWSRRLVDGSLLRFDMFGRLREARDRFDNTTRYVYKDLSQRLDSIIDVAGKAIVFGYDGSNRLTWIRDVPGNRTTYVTINNSNDVVQIQDAVGGRPFQEASYDGAHRLQSRLDRRSAQWSYYYDFAGRIASDSTPAVTVNDTTGRRLGTRYRSPASAILVDPASGTGTWSAPATPKTDSAGIARVAPSSGATQVLRIDRYGALLEVLAPLQAYAHYTRNEHGQVESAADSTGSRIYQWSGPRLVYEQNTVTGQYIVTEWNTTYHLVTRRYGAGLSEVRNYYGLYGGLDSTRIGGEPASRFTYDDRGRVVTATDPRGHTATYYRDGTTFLNSDSVRAGVRRTAYLYDTLGRVIRVSGPGGQFDSTAYDALNRVVRRVGPLGVATAFAYADSLNVTHVTDAKDQVYQFQTNLVGWVTAVTDPNSNTDNLMHDRGGRVIRWTNRRGQQTTFAYDSLSRLLGRGLYGGRTNAFEYHARWMAASNEEGSDTVRAVEDTSYAIAVRGGAPYTVRSRYDRSARELRLAVWRDGQTALETSYLMDSTSRLRAVVPPSAATDSLRHNTDGLLSSINLHGAVTRTNAYRPRDDLARLSYTPSGVQSAFGAEFVHDSLGRVVERRNGDRTQIERYTYDTLARLGGFQRYNASPACAQTDTTSELGSLCSGSLSLVAQDTFTYDQVGNRTDGGATVDWGNRQRLLRGYRLDYDADGNVTRKYTDDGSFNQYLYWNSANELDSVRTWSQGAWQTARFGYDAFGQRVRKNTSAGTTYYVWAAGQVVAEYDGSGNLVRHFTYYQGTDQPHSVLSGGARHYFASDGRGNAMGLISSSGSAIEAQYQFSPFGITESATETVANAVRFSGRELDLETGLYYNRARYYDPQLGRFVSEDPAGLAAGANPYPFAGNDPVNGRDPTGRWCEQRWHPESASAPPAVGLAPSGGGGYLYLHCEDLFPGDLWGIREWLGGTYGLEHLWLSWGWPTPSNSSFGSWAPGGGFNLGQAAELFAAQARLIVHPDRYCSNLGTRSARRFQAGRVRLHLGYIGYIFPRRGTFVGAAYPVFPATSVLSSELFEGGAHEGALYTVNVHEEEHHSGFLGRGEAAAEAAEDRCHWP